MDSEHRVLTPESVEFVYELGGIGSRMVAALLDHLIVTALLLCIWFAGLIGGCLSIFFAGPILAVSILATFLLYFGYFAYFEWKWNGQTPGKRLMDLRVIDDRGMSIDFFQAVVRNLFRVVDMLPSLFALDFLAFGFYAVGGLSALAGRSNKRLGDWAAGTLVVRTRKRVMPYAILAPSEKYNTLQEDGALRSRIRARLGLEERETLLQLCLRRGELEFDARQALFAEAAEYLEKRLEIRREEFLSEEKFVQNIAAVALATQDAGAGVSRHRSAASDPAAVGR
jgi:uncharacterized RDD family membrane protein YckC